MVVILMNLVHSEYLLPFATILHFTSLQDSVWMDVAWIVRKTFGRALVSWKKRHITIALPGWNSLAETPKIMFVNLDCSILWWALWWNKTITHLATWHLDANGPSSNKPNDLRLVHATLLFREPRAVYIEKSLFPRLSTYTCRWFVDGAWGVVEVGWSSSFFLWLKQKNNECHGLKPTALQLLLLSWFVMFWQVWALAPKSWNLPKWCGFGVSGTIISEIFLQVGTP